MGDTARVPEVVTKKSAVMALASQLTVSKEELVKVLKETAFKDCKTDSEFLSAVVVASTYRLNPLLKEIYAFPGSRGGVTPVVSIDGWIKIVSRQDDYDGVELIENEATPEENCPGGLKSVTAKFYLKNRAHPVSITEYMSECYDKNKQPWVRWPRRMLRHKAYIQGARVAFGIAGIYDEDEAQRIVEAQAAEVPTSSIRPPQAITAQPEPKPAEPSVDVLPVVYTVKGALDEVKEGEIFSVEGAVLNARECTLPNKKIVVDYVISSEDGSTMKISKFEPAVEGVMLGDIIRFCNVKGTRHEGKMKYLAESGEIISKAQGNEDSQ